MTSPTSNRSVPLAMVAVTVLHSVQNTIAFSSVTTMLLERSVSGQVPLSLAVTFIASALLSFGTTRLLARRRPSVLWTQFSWFMIPVSVSLLMWAGMPDAPRSLYSIVFIVCLTSEYITTTMIETVMVEHLSSKDLEAYGSKIFAAATVANLAFGFSLNLLTQFFSSYALAWVWPIHFSLQLVIMFVLRRIVRGRTATAMESAETPRSTANRLYRSHFFIVLAISACTTGAIYAIAETLFFEKTKDFFPTDAAMNAYLGNIFGLTYAAMIVMNVWVVPWTIRRLGVRRTLQIHAFYGVFGFMLVYFHPGLLAATLLFAGLDALVATLHRSTKMLVFSRLPRSQRAEAQNLTEGAFANCGAALGALLLVGPLAHWDIRSIALAGLPFVIAEFALFSFLKKTFAVRLVTRPIELLSHALDIEKAESDVES